MAKPRIKLKVRHGSGAVSHQTTKAAMGSHVAVASQAGLSIFDGYLPNPDPILKRLGKDISVYRELLRDAVVGSLFRRRKAVITALEWQLNGDDAPPKAIELTEKALSGIDLYRLIKDILNAAAFGYAPLEILWAYQGGYWLPSAVVAKPQEWFDFNRDGELCLRRDFTRLEPVPAHKFLCPTQEASYTNPYGMGDLAMVYWPCVFKRAGLKFWATFTEKYGTPWIIGKEPRSNTQRDTDKLLDSLEALAGDAVGTIPNDSSVEIIEASGKASSVDAYSKLIRYCRSEIAIAILGQDQTTEQTANYASAKAGLEVTEDIRDDDKRLVEATINQLIRWVVQFNIGDVPCPKFTMYEAENVEESTVAARDEKLTRQGVQFSKKYYKRQYKLEDDDFELVETAEPSSALSSADFAEQAAAQPPDQLATQLNHQTARHTNDWLERIRTVLDNAESLEQFRDELNMLIPYLSFDEYAALMGDALTAANLGGRYEVQQESEL